MDRRIYERYVIQIAAQGSLTKAAAVLGISQPALSLGLTNLEKDLGYKLFNRKSVPISFTSEGKLYYEYIKQVQILSDDLQKRIEHLKTKNNSSVVIGGPVAYVEAIITEAVSAFRKKAPSDFVSIKAAPMAELIEMSEKGTVDCFISTSEQLPEKFEKILLHKEKVYLCIPKNNPINTGLEDYHRTPGELGVCFDFSLLKGQEFIYLEDGQPLQEQMLSFFEKYKISPINKTRVNQVSTAVNLSLRGEGICFASEAALKGNIDLSSIYIYNLPEDISGREIYIAYNRELFQSDACTRLIDVLRAI